MSAPTVTPQQLHAGLRAAVDAMEGEVAADCRWCDGDGSWTGGQRPRMVPVRHKDGCPYETARAVCVLYEAKHREVGAF